MVCERCCAEDGGWQRCVRDGVWEMVCERWWLTKMCVRNGVWEMVYERWWLTKCVQDGVWKMVCERCCVEDGGWQRCVRDGVWEMVCERWWLTKMCVRDGVWEMVCERWRLAKRRSGRRSGRRRSGRDTTPHKDVANNSPPITKPVIMWRSNAILNANSGLYAPYLFKYNYAFPQIRWDHHPK